MNKSIKNEFAIICWAAALITLIMTPWVNVDSLVIPKLIILLLVSLWTLPKVLVNKHMFLQNNILKTFLVLTILVLIQLVLVILNSTAPNVQQIYGRTGRGLGLLSEVSLIILTLAASLFISHYGLKIFLKSLLGCATITSLYAIFQSFGWDIFDWVTRTNGIIGTLGNPNFQSSFAAMALGPAIVYLIGPNRKKLFAIFIALTLVSVIYIAKSTQGYLLSLATLAIISIFYFWYKKRIIAQILSGLTVILSTLILLGMLNIGFFSRFLHKSSVQSRGEFFRAAINTAKDNPFFGIGLDSWGDYYWIYRDINDLNGIKEFADNAHNYFLQMAATGGFILAFLQFAITCLALFSFFMVQKQLGKFDKNFIAIFCTWVTFQMQALISPANISMLIWNAIVTGSIIGLTAKDLSETQTSKIGEKANKYLKTSFVLVVGGCILVYPLYNSDRLQLLSAKSGNAVLAINSAESFPKSTLRYIQISEALSASGLEKQALELAKSATEFNPNSIASWGLILLSPMSTYEERIEAKKEIIRLDPLNNDIKGYTVPIANR